MARSRPSAFPPDAAPPAVLAILTFVPQEAGAVRRLLAAPRRLALPGVPATAGELAGIAAAVCLLGTGSRRSLHGFEALCESLSLTAAAVCGVAGALDPTLSVGDVLLAQCVLDESGRAVQATAAPGVPAPRQLRTGVLLTTSNVLTTREQKRSAAGRALAVDMETAALVRRCEELGLPWCALRAISDTADETLPIDFNRCLDAEGSISIPRVALRTAGRPFAIPSMIALARRTSAACASLAEAAAGYLPPWYRAVT